MNQETILHNMRAFHLDKKCRLMPPHPKANSAGVTNNAEMVDGTATMFVVLDESGELVAVSDPAQILFIAASFEITVEPETEKQ